MIFKPAVKKCREIIRPGCGNKLVKQALLVIKK
jgi:hypothetical protein